MRLDENGAFRAVKRFTRNLRPETLHAVFVNRQDQRELFDQAFHIFWRNQRLLERMAGWEEAATRARTSDDVDPELLEKLEAFGYIAD